MITRSISTYVDVEVDLDCPKCHAELVCPECGAAEIEAAESDEYTALHWFRTAVQGSWHVRDLRSKVDGAYGEALVDALEVLRDLGVRA